MEYCRCRKWLSNCKRDDLAHKSPAELNKTYRVCSLHFEKSQFTNCACDRLMHCAIPTPVDSPIQPQWLNVGPDEIDQCCEVAKLKGPHMNRTICLQMTLRNDVNRKETDHCYSTTENGLVTSSVNTPSPTNHCCSTAQNDTDHCYSAVKGEINNLDKTVENAAEECVVSEPSNAIPLSRGGFVDVTSLNGTYRIRVTPAGHGLHEKSTQCCMTMVPGSKELPMHNTKQLLLKRKLRAAQCRISKLKRQLRNEQESQRTRRRCLSIDDLLKAAEAYLSSEQLVAFAAQMKANKKKNKRRKQMLSAG